MLANRLDYVDLDIVFGRHWREALELHLNCSGFAHELIGVYVHSTELCKRMLPAGRVVSGYCCQNHAQPLCCQLRFLEIRVATRATDRVNSIIRIAGPKHTHDESNQLSPTLLPAM